MLLNINLKKKLFDVRRIDNYNYVRFLVYKQSIGIYCRWFTTVCVHMKDLSAVFSHTVQVTQRGFCGCIKLLLLDTMISVHSIKVKRGLTFGRT